MNRYLNQWCLMAIACLSLLTAAGLCCAQTQTEKDASTSWEQNPLVNASFEAGESLPTGWRALQGNTTSSSLETIMAWDMEFARTGERSIYIRRGATGPLRWSNAEPQAVTPGVTYQLRAWFRVHPANAGAVTLGVRSRRHYADTGRLWEQGHLVKVDHDTQGQWQAITLEFTPPQGVELVWLMLGQSGSWPPRGHGPSEVWFDDVSLWQQQAQLQAETQAPPQN